MMNFVMDLVMGAYGFVWQVVGVLIFAFHCWMLIDALRRGETVWALFIFFFPIINDVAYFCFVWWPSRGNAVNPLTGFELPGAADRRRIKQLQADIHHLDKAHLHLQLADIYFSMGKLEQAEESYRAAY